MIRKVFLFGSPWTFSLRTSALRTTFIRKHKLPLMNVNILSIKLIGSREFLEWYVFKYNSIHDKQLENTSIQNQFQPTKRVKLLSEDLGR